MVSRDESLVGQSTFKKWPLVEFSENPSISDQLLQMLTKDYESRLNLICEGCTPDSPNCNCSVNAVSFENKFAVFILLEIGHLSMTKWCPLAEVETDFFFCDAKQTHKISASYICDGTVHCPNTGADETFALCNPLDVRFIAVTPVLINFVIALCCAIYLARQQDKKERKKLTTNTEGHTEIVRALKLINENVLAPSNENEELMQKEIQELPTILQLSLARITRNIEVKSGDSPMKFFEPAVESILAEEEQQTAFLVLTKEDDISSTKFKTAVMKEMEPKGTSAKIKKQLLKFLPYKLRIGIKTAKEVFGNLSGMFTIPAQDVKDIGTIVSLNYFHENILQGKDDDFPLEQFVINLAVVTVAIFLLRRLNSLAENDTEDKGTAFCCDFLRFSFNLHNIPFVTEAFLCIETIKESLAGHKKKEAIQEQLGKLKNSDNEDETDEIWKQVCATSEDIGETERRIEDNNKKRSKVKIVCCIGDIIQGSALVILMLRSDLRIRGLLGLSKMANNIGINPSKLCLFLYSV